MSAASDNQKTIADSAIENYRVELFPENISPDGIIYGSRLLDVVSKVACNIALNHAERPCFCHGVDFVRYFSLAKRGDMLTCKASINRVWKTSMEIGVKLVGDDFLLLQEKKILSAYFTFHPANENNESILLPQIYPIGQVQKRRFLQANKRRKLLDNMHRKH